jgi:hypothetical protein
MFSRYEIEHHHLKDGIQVFHDLFTNYYATGIKLKHVLPYPIFCRVLRGKTKKDFALLSPDRNRKFAFLAGPDTATGMIGMDKYQILESIGYSRRRIDDLESDGVQFRLLVTQQKDLAKIKVTPRLATWDVVCQQASIAHPQMAPLFSEALPKLRKTSYLEIMHGTDKCLKYVRDFLEITEGLTELFMGTGIIYSSGEAQRREYLVPNLPLHSFCKMTTPLS